ncbi:MAG: DEAD/DEAH box helicase [Candidatus Nezhaarchaeales archaeon]
MFRNAFELLSEEIRRELAALGFTRPTEPQERAIPLILSGKSLLIVSPTGTGKTEAAVLPVFDMMVRLKREGVCRGIMCIYVTPLRALNRDLWGRLSRLAESIGLSIEVRHGDTPQHARRKQAQQPPDMLITTPETLQAILIGRVLRRSLINVRWVIIDEVHELVADKRGVQLSIALERLKRITGRRLQRIGLSATVGSIEVVKKFLAGSDGDVDLVYVPMPRNMEIMVDSPALSGHEEITSILQVAPHVSSAILKIADEVRKHNSVLVFTNTREATELLSSRLALIANGFEVKAHHGSLSREERVQAEEDFKFGRVKALICTSSLELGIDIGSVDFVIQFMSPRQSTPLVQRVGRSAHRVGGVARGLIVSYSSDDVIESAVLAKRAINQKLEEIKVHECALDVLAHQVVGLVIDEGTIEVDEALSVIKGAYPYRNLTREDFLETVKFLHDRGVIKLVGSKLKRAGRATIEFYLSNLSMIPDVKKYDVISLPDKRKVGTLDEEFVATKIKEMMSIILGGRVWKLVGVEESKVYVEPSDDVVGAIPAWIGELIPVPMDVALEVASIRRRIEELYKEGADLKEALKGYPLTERAIEVALSDVVEHLKLGLPLPHDKRIVVEGLGNYVVVHACLGSKANELLGLLLSSMLSSSTTSMIHYRADQYRVLLISPRSIRASFVAKLLKELSPEDVDSLVHNLMPLSDVYLWRLFHVAKRMGVVEKDVDVKAFSKAYKFLLGTIVDRAARMEVLIDKLDVEGLKQILELIKKNVIEVVWFEGGERASPLAMPILNKYVPLEVISLIKQGGDKSLDELVLERLMERTVKLVCMYCGDWTTTRKVKYLPDDIKCPKCGARYITVTWPGDDKIEKLIKKRMTGKLTKQEMDEIKKYQMSAGLVLTYGKKAVMVLAARGVGPQTASRILARDARGEGTLLKDVLEAEKTYIRTRMYWSQS